MFCVLPAIYESRIEIVLTNMHILKERYSFASRQSISLVSQYFNLIPKVYFWKMVELLENIFTFGRWMLSIAILYWYVNWFWKSVLQLIDATITVNKIGINSIQGPKVKIISKNSIIFLKNAFGIKLKYLETSEIDCPEEKL